MIHRWTSPSLLSFCFTLSLPPQTFHFRRALPLSLHPTALPVCNLQPPHFSHRRVALQLDPNGIVLCTMYMYEIEVDAEAKQLSCKHLYHSNCIKSRLKLLDSCPLYRFWLTAVTTEEKEEEDVDGGDGGLTLSKIRRQLRVTMVRLSELMEEEEDDFYDWGLL